MIIQITFLGFITIISIFYVNYIIPIITKFISVTIYNIFFTNIIILVQLDNFALFNELNNLKIKTNQINKINEINMMKEIRQINTSSFNLKNIYTSVNNRIQRIKKNNSSYF